MVSKKEILRIMKRRQRRLRKRIRKEDTTLNKLAHKSRYVRLTCRAGPRKNWFVDREQELSLAIGLLEGKWEEKDYVGHLAGDKLDKMLSSMG